MNLAVVIQIIIMLWACAFFCVGIVRRKLPRSLYFAFLSAAVFFLSLGYLWQLLSPGPDTALLGRNLQEAALAYAGAFFFLLTLDYFHGSYTRRWKTCVVLAIPTALALPLITGLLNGVYLYAFSYAQEPFPHLVFTGGYLYWANAVFTGGMFLLGLYIALTALTKGSKFNTPKKHAALVLGFGAASFLVLGLRAFAIPLFDCACVAFLAVQSVYCALILRLRMLDWIGFVRERAMDIDATQDGFIFLDKHEGYMDANHVAKAYFPDFHTFSVGTPVARVKDFPRVLLDTDIPTHEFTLRRQSRLIHLKATLCHIDWNGRSICTCIVLHDITRISELTHEVAALATNDPLTGLYNRKTFFRLGNRDFGLARRTGAPLSVMMIDIDDFRKINDRYGHQCGDEVLQGLSAYFLRRLRHTDVVGRYGGEEFCFVLPNTNAEGCEILANMLCQEIAQRELACGGSTVRVTVSVGCAVMNPLTHQSMDDLVHDSDEAMHTAKADGKNRVCPPRLP